LLKEIANESIDNRNWCWRISHESVAS
jgi:hypothetical protein